jgi:hypothetical protein
MLKRRRALCGVKRAHAPCSAGDSKECIAQACVYNVVHMFLYLNVYVRLCVDRSRDRLV